jgi:hypothetical protein
MTEIKQLFPKIPGNAAIVAILLWKSNHRKFARSVSKNALF